MDTGAIADRGARAWSDRRRDARAGHRIIDGMIAADADWRRDAPAFAALSDHLYVPFAVRRLRYARVAWLNRDWFVAAGRDVREPSERLATERWLLERYAVGVPGEDDPADFHAGPSRAFWADRYGAPGGSMHGGSGRVGTLGDFNVKGIGRTPLVSDRSDWYHTHGCMWLEEAVREAIVATVAGRVFPHGAVPVIAVIDAGCHYRWRDGNRGARRALVVRPAFLRVASLMRSIFFGRSGTPESEQWTDARRVHDLWTADWPVPGIAGTLADAFAAVGRQYGFGGVLRLWPGPPFASNLTLDGALVDFGSFRGVGDWSRAQGEAASHGFGAEETLIASAARTLERIGRSHGIAVLAAGLVARFAGGVASGEADALTAHGIDPGSTAAAEFARLRARQQVRITGLAGAGSAETCIQRPGHAVNVAEHQRRAVLARWPIRRPARSPGASFRQTSSLPTDNVRGAAG